MENKIKLRMNESKDIEILVNDDIKCTIYESKRELSAKMIYDLLDHKKGDTFIVELENKASIDLPVLSYFKELFSDICKSINEMDVDVVESS